MQRGGWYCFLLKYVQKKEEQNKQKNYVQNYASFMYEGRRVVGAWGGHSEFFQNLYLSPSNFNDFALGLPKVYTCYLQKYF